MSTAESAWGLLGLIVLIVWLRWRGTRRIKRKMSLPRSLTQRHARVLEIQGARVKKSPGLRPGLLTLDQRTPIAAAWASAGQFSAACGALSS
jgi:hypothetical protein